MRDEGKKRPDWKQLWKKLGAYKYVLIVILAGIVLLALPTAGEKGTSERIPAEGAGISFDLESMEKELERALSKMEGVGEVTVVLTLKSGSRKVLAEDSRVSGSESSRETVVVSQGSSTENALLLQEVYPQFRGALVVCSGGENASIRLKVLEAVMALTGLNSDCISICAGNG